MGCLNPNRELDSAAALRLKALRINQILGSDQGMADNYGHLGEIYRRQGDLREAEKMFRHALAIEQARGPSVRLAGYYLNLGRICLKRKAVVQAAELLARGLELFTHLADQNGQVDCLVRLGLACLQNGDFNHAEDHFAAALIILNGCEAPAARAAVYNFLGALHIERADGAAAAACLYKALSLYESLGDAQGMGLAHGHLGLVAILQDCPGKARAHLITAIQTHRRLGLTMRLADNLANLGGLYWSKGRRGPALVMYRRALTMFQSTKNHAKYEQTRRLLAGLEGR